VGACTCACVGERGNEGPRVCAIGGRHWLDGMGGSEACTSNLAATCAHLACALHLHIALRRKRFWSDSASASRQVAVKGWVPSCVPFASCARLCRSVCMRACVRGHVRACVHACMLACVAAPLPTPLRPQTESAARSAEEQRRRVSLDEPALSRLHPQRGAAPR